VCLKVGGGGNLSATYLLSMPLSSLREAASGCVRGEGLRKFKGSWKAVVVAVFVFKQRGKIRPSERGLEACSLRRTSYEGRNDDDAHDDGTVGN